MVHCYISLLLSIPICHIVILYVTMLHSMSYYMPHCYTPCLTVCHRKLFDVTLSCPIVTSYCYIWLFGVLWLSSCIKWNIRMVCFMLWILWGSDSWGCEILVKMITISYHFIFFVVENDNVFCYSGTFWQSLFYRARDVKEIYSDLQEFQTRSSDLTQWLVVQIEMLENAENDSLSAQQLNDKVKKCNV